MTGTSRALPCAFCGVERTNRWRHEKICPQRNGRPLPDRGTNTAKGRGARQRLSELADQRCAERLATVDVTDARRIWAELRERGYTRAQIKATMSRGRQLGLIPPEARITLTEISALQRAEFDERVRELFKRGVDLNYPLRHTLDQHPDLGFSRYSIDHVSKRVKQLGLVPPGFHFRTKPPAVPNAAKDWRREYNLRRRSTQAPRAAKPKSQPSTKAPSNARETQAPTGFSTGTRAKKPKYDVTRSALEGDGVKSPCPHGCGESFNAFRMRRHVDECSMREEDEDG